MRTLNLYKQREYSTVTLNDGDEYKIPNEYTVEETERLLERRKEYEAIKEEEVQDGKEEEQAERFFRAAFNQLEILFQHYHPEMTAEELRELLTPSEALEILNFFDEYRHMARTGMAEDGKKKVKSKKARTELRDLRRIIASMVVNGFSLSDIKKLYIDELYDYYTELIYVLEKSGKIKKGTYTKMSDEPEKNDAEDTVNKLRSQMRTSLSNNG